MPITKIEAARRQLETAIELFFKGGDPISIGTLAYNALEISAVLAARNGGADFRPTSLDDVAKALNTSVEVIAKSFHHPRNFFKHADRDPDDVLESFDESDNESLLALAVLQYGEVAQRSVEMWSALIWFYSLHPELTIPGPMEEVVTQFAFIRDMTRPQQLRARADVLAELQRRAK